MRRIRESSSSLIPVIACAILVVFLAGCEDQQKAQMAVEEENKALALRVFEELWNQKKLDLIEEIFAADLVCRVTGSPELNGHEGYRQLVTAYLTAYPDLQFTIEERIAEGDKVVTRWTSTGTHKGELMGIAPTGAQIEVTGVTIDRIADGKILDERSNWDALLMWQQLGVDPPMGQEAAAEEAPEAAEE